MSSAHTHFAPPFLPPQYPLRRGGSILLQKDAKGLEVAAEDSHMAGEP
jgi:hypothetical protein